MCKVRKNIAYFSSNIVGIGLKQLKYFFEQCLSRENGLRLTLDSSRDVRNYPAGLPSHYFFVMFEYFFEWIEDSC